MRGLLPLAVSVLLAGCAATPLQPTDKPGDVAFASKDNPNWRVYNAMPATAKFWDINQLQALDGGVGTFPFQQYDSPTTGSFAIYLLLNSNYDITDKIIAANVAISGTPGAFYTRSGTTCSGAFVRLEFQDVTAGPYDSNDYWWSANAVDLSTLTTDQALSASTADANRANWTNQAGLPATNTTPNWTDWTGATVALSPYDGFTKALKNVKQLGLSFGSSCRYASGVAVQNTGAAFDLLSYTVTP